VQAASALSFSVAYTHGHTDIYSTKKTYRHRVNPTHINKHTHIPTHIYTKYIYSQMETHNYNYVHIYIYIFIYIYLVAGLCTPLPLPR